MVSLTLTQTRGRSPHLSMVRSSCQAQVYRVNIDLLCMSQLERHPKLQYLARLLGELCLGEESNRILVYNCWPMTQWFCEGFLKVSTILLSFSVSQPGPAGN
jgi:hypothetical protein